jgi:uncharacterized protein with HEPN domain
MQPNDLNHLNQILWSAQNIQQLLLEKNLANFSLDGELRAACLWQIMVMGWSSQYLSPNFKKEILEFKWDQFSDRSNFFKSHFYNYDIQELWDYVKIEIPNIIYVLQTMINSDKFKEYCQTLTYLPRVTGNDHA